MLIKSLQVENFRNIAHVRIDLHPVLNAFFGANGAGKTSILESVVVLSRGRSFRTRQADELVGPGAGSFLIFAEAQDEEQRVRRLGLERAGKRWRARIDGQEVRQLSRLTRDLPLILMEPNSHLLVSGPPEIRRKYLDWGLFHVEQGFLDRWRRFSRALKQRNAALRERKFSVLDGIEEVLGREGGHLDRYRDFFCAGVAQRVQEVLEELDAGLKDVEVHYQRGWSSGSYTEALRSDREKDMERGSTSSGPHRAEIRIFTGQMPARAVLSRGEQKLFSAAMLLAQARLLDERGEKPVLLLDDLASEFDEKRFRRVLDWAVRSGSQVWMSGSRQQTLGSEHKAFHVEHGEVRNDIISS